MPSLSEYKYYSVKSIFQPSVLVLGLISVLSGCSVADKSVGELSAAAKASDQVQLQNTEAGHSFWFLPMPDADRTAVAITWHSDLPDVSVGREATPRVGIELMLNGGAGGLPAEDIIADFEDLDSGSRLWVQPQEISGFIVSPRAHMDKAAEIANLVLTQPNLEQKWFDREKKKWADEAAERESVVAGHAWNLFREITIGDHPYKRFWSLTPVDGIKSIELEDVKSWHANAFSTESMTVAVAGDADIDAVSAAIDRVLVDMPSAPTAEMREFPAPLIPGKTILLHRPDAEKSVILAIADLPSHADGLDIPLQLGVGVLGYGKQSRLFKAVRSGLRASYGFGAGTWDMTREYPVMYLTGEVETAKLQEAMDETRAAYEKFRQSGINLIEFPIAKRIYLQRIREEMKKPSSVAYMLMEANLNNYGKDHVSTLISQINGLKRGVVNQVVEESLPEFGALLKIIVTPDANAIEGACVITEFEQWTDC